VKAIRDKIDLIEKQQVQEQHWREMQSGNERFRSGAGDVNRDDQSGGDVGEGHDG
jgi:hypothetical protein